MLPFFISDEMGFSDEELLLFSAASGKAVEYTATGNPLTFVTDLARPLKSLLIPFTPQQEGSGDPSPENVRPILGWNGLSLNHSEENLIDVSVFPSKSSGGITYTNNGDGSITLNGVCTAFNPQAIALPVNLPAGKYYLTVNNDKAKTGTGNLYVGMNDINGADYGASLGSINAKATINASAPLRRMFINIFAGAELDNVTIKPMLVSGEGYEDFKPYTGEKHDISFPSAVYGGTLDVVSGVLTVEWTIKALNEWYTFNRSTSYEHPFFYGSFGDREPGRTTDFFCDVFKKDTTHIFGSVFGDGAEDLSIAFSGDTGSQNIYIRDDSCLSREDFLEAHKNDHVCYKLAEPQEIQLTPEQITALVGDNTIWSDADGSMTAAFLKKG